MADVFSRESLQQYAAEKRAEFEQALEKIVEIPSVSVEPDRKAEVRRAADYAVGMLESFGAKATLYPTPGHPIIHGRFDRGEGLPTVTVYNHLDVQPAEGDDWKTPPFDFVKQGDRYFARGTTDDKGPAITALFGARYAWENGVPANIHFLWEFEEEIGSPNFEATIRKEAKGFATDSVVVSDTVWVSRSRPAQPAGLRGLQGFRFELQTGQTDQHSGTAGGAAQHSLCPGDELAGAERFGDIVVGAQFQAAHDVILFAAYGEQNYGRIGLFADAAADGKPVQLGQVDVQDDEVGLFFVPIPQGSLAVVALNHLESLAAQREGYQVGQHAVVVYNQRFHRLIILSGDRHLRKVPVTLPLVSLLPGV